MYMYQDRLMVLIYIVVDDLDVTYMTMVKKTIKVDNVDDDDR